MKRARNTRKHCRERDLLVMFREGSWPAGLRVTSGPTEPYIAARSGLPMWGGGGLRGASPEGAPASPYGLGARRDTLAATSMPFREKHAVEGERQWHVNHRDRSLHAPTAASKAPIIAPGSEHGRPTPPQLAPAQNSAARKAARLGHRFFATSR